MSLADIALCSSSFICFTRSLLKLLGQKVVSPLTVLPFWVLGLPLLVAVSLELVFQLFLLVSPLPSVLLPVLVIVSSFGSSLSISFTTTSVIYSYYR